MSKNIKKTIIFLISLIVVLVIIGGVYMFLHKDKDVNDQVSPLPSPSENTPSGDSASPDPSGTPATSTPSPDETDNNTPSPSENVPVTVNYTIEVPDGFTREQGDTDIIYYGSDKNAFIELKFIPNTTSQDVSPGFLDSYLEYNDISYDGINQIENTELFGRGVTAENDSVAGKAFLIDRDGGVFAAAIISPKDDSGLSEQFMSILQSLKFE